MFVACPHCQFLVARDPRTHALPVACTRCGKPLPSDEATGTTTSPSLATFLHPAPSATPVVGEPEVEGVEAGASPDETRDQLADTTTPDAIDTEAAAPEPAPTTADTLAPIDVAETFEASAADAITPPDAHGAAPVAADADADADAVLHNEEPAVEAPAAAIVGAPPKPRGPAGPRFLQRTRTTSVHARHARVQWFAVVALSLLLCAQVLLADRARLATQAGWRPIVVALCGVFRCDVPTWREPAAFTMLSRDVRPIIGSPGTLQAQATFRNEARWSQAWPVILLTLKDADGRTLGARALEPADYLPRGEASSSIGPGQSAQMAVHVKEPSASVVAFSFDFR